LIVMCSAPRNAHHVGYAARSPLAGKHAVITRPRNVRRRAAVAWPEGLWRAEPSLNCEIARAAALTYAHLRARPRASLGGAGGVTIPATATPRPAGEKLAFSAALQVDAYDTALRPRGRFQKFFRLPNLRAAA